MFKGKPRYGIKWEVEKLLSLKSVAQLSMQEKIAVLEYYGIKIPRREIARSMLDLISDKVRRQKNLRFEVELGNMTVEETKAAVRRVLDKYLKEAEGRFIADRTEQMVTERLEQELGEKNAASAARKMKYRWVSVLRSNTCPDCKRRHGREERMQVWRAMGIPRAGATRCRQHCQCQLKPVVDTAVGVSVKPKSTLEAAAE